MARGRSRDITIVPSRALAQQREYRSRKAAHLASVEERCRQLEEENQQLKSELEEERLRRIQMEEKGDCARAECRRETEKWRNAVYSLQKALANISSLLPSPQLRPLPQSSGLTGHPQSQDVQLDAPFHPDNDESASISPSPSAASNDNLASVPGSPSCCDGIISCGPNSSASLLISSPTKSSPLHPSQHKHRLPHSHPLSSHTSTPARWSPPVAPSTPLTWGTSMVRTSARYDENCCLGVIPCDEDGNIIP